jgi:hypothetical protein
MNLVINTRYGSPQWSQEGLFIGQVRGSVNIVRTTPNYPRSHTEYMVIRSLQSFTTCKHFILSLSATNTCLVSWRLCPAASDADGTFRVGWAFDAIIITGTSGVAVDWDLHHRLCLCCHVGKTLLKMKVKFIFLKPCMHDEAKLREPLGALGLGLQSCGL